MHGTVMKYKELFRSGSITEVHSNLVQAFKQTDENAVRDQRQLSSCIDSQWLNRECLSTKAPKQASKTTSMCNLP